MGLIKKHKCTECSKNVDIKSDKYVVLSTLNRPNNLPDEHDYFHFDCWIKYFEKRVELKMRTSNNQLDFMANLMKTPLVQNALSNFANLQAQTIRIEPSKPIKNNKKRKKNNE